MNPFCKIEFSESECIETLLGADSNFTAIISSFTSFHCASSLNLLARHHSLPFYTLKSSGLYAFCYADFGPSLTFTHQNTTTTPH